ncbi:hypothetical protein [Polymorphobacter fuscus]|uniref:DUF1049 domain-containing protein n=1 Tax=Sandarakinorhabdus fusca TaxID=1439888 RepID=A0A7C9GPW2_9SPHN|nr:hypothetical protein [Polymorphobacter fuscus]KAB7645451.1 hypothetical protein F9290_11465 [Polymorphobacter fuscus]MQT17875.1 hypothetical protein [Polymorphobacter fuscus]NJC08504.1 putative integral membrane protein [Polymorphobacter fuscus]
MTVLRWILVTALAVAFLLLAVANWTPVPFRLPDGAMVNIRLPLLLAAAFVAGWLPTWLVHIGAKAQWKRKLAKTGVAPAEPRPSPLPSQAQPTIVPPAGA